jgi:PAS domain S-box-containing protein
MSDEHCEPSGARAEAGRESLLRQELAQLRVQHDHAQESALRFQQVAQAMPQLVWTSIAGGQADFINDRWQQYTGMSLDVATQGSTWLDVLHPDDREMALAKWRVAFAEGGVFEAEIRLRRHDGVYRWHLNRAVPICDEHGQFQRWLGTATDIESQKQAEANLKQLADTLEQRVSERTAQLRAAAAELAQVEQRERRRLSQTLHDHLQQLLVAARVKVSMARARLGAYGEGDQYLQDVDKLLHTTIEASRDLAVDLSPPVLYERGLGEALQWLGRRFAKQHQLDVDVCLHVTTSEWRPPEPVRDFLFQSARELLFNVVKHAGTTRAKLEVHDGAQDGHIELIVSDDGHGCDEAQLLGRGPDGSGLGLSSMRQRAELWGGTVSVRSRAGGGCVVIVRLPARAARPSAPAARAPDPLPRPPQVTGPRPRDHRVRVILADDHAVLRDGLAGLLRQHGFLVVGEAEDGRQAIELALMLQPDVVLMDVSMPHVNGIDATRAICERAPSVRIIGLSMYDDVTVSQAMRDAGATTFLTKNSPSEQLIATIRSCVSATAVR